MTIAIADVNHLGSGGGLFERRLQTPDPDRSNRARPVRRETSRALAILSAVAASGWCDAQSGLDVGRGRAETGPSPPSEASTVATNSACCRRFSTSIEADVSHKNTSSSGLPSGTTSRCQCALARRRRKLHQKVALGAAGVRNRRPHRLRGRRLRRPLQNRASACTLAPRIRRWAECRCRLVARAMRRATYALQRQAEFTVTVKRKLTHGRVRNNSLRRPYV